MPVPCRHRWAAVLLVAACCAASVSASAPASAQDATRPQDMDPPATHALPLKRAAPADGEATAMTVLLVLGLAASAAVAVALRSGALPGWRWPRPDLRRPTVQRLSSHVLGKGASLHAVRWHDEELLIGCTDGQVTLLGRRPAGAPQGAGQ